MPRLSPSLRACACLVSALLVVACAEPPHKEMDQAQGAIDAARAAGADIYAAEEFTGATEALDLSHGAVGDRDYRLALNYALESRERAQNAARDAAEARARVRGEAERVMAQVQALLTQADARMQEAAARTPRPRLDDVQQELDHIHAEVQKAGETMQAGDYLGAQPALAGMRERIASVMAAIDEAVNAQTAQRRR